MSFDAAWLDLREPADRAARDPALLAAAAGWLGGGIALDLGCGTGALARAFPSGPRWRLVDRDPDLLGLAAARTPGAETCRLDLNRLDALPLDGVRLVVASALFDLASAAWVDGLAERAARHDLGLYASLTYDGGLAFAPALNGDAAVRAAFNAHQRRDKGLGGPALGPEAGPAIAAALRAHGYTVRMAASPWRLGPEDDALRRALTGGVATAAREAGCAIATAWGQARSAASAAGSCEVGHVDLLALPPSAQSKTTSVSRP